MIRVYEVGDAFPDPYKWNIACRWVDRETVEATGHRSNRPDDDSKKALPKPSHWKALLKTLGQFGVKTVFYTRYKAGKERVYRHKTGEVGR